MTTLKRVLFCLCALLLFIWGPSGAPGTLLGSDTENLNVNANVISACQISASPLNFGDYAQGGGIVLGTASIQVTCGGANDSWSVDANGGQNPALSTRRMKHANASEFLNYQLSLFANFSSGFGSGVGGGPIQALGSFNFSIYGRIPGNQSPSTGSYSDTVILTLTP